MRSLPIRTDRMRFALVDVVPVTVYETGEVKTDKQGRPAWRLNCLVLFDGDPGGEVLPIRVNSEKAPDFPALSTICFENLSALPWQQNDRSGVAFMADGVSLETASLNGRVKNAERVAEAVTA